MGNAVGNNNNNNVNRVGGTGGGGPGNCDASYPDVCISSPPPDLDCGEIRFVNFKVLSTDPHGFDRDRDGIGCDNTDRVDDTGGNGGGSGGGGPGNNATDDVEPPPVDVEPPPVDVEPPPVDGGGDGDGGEVLGGNGDGY